VTPLDRPDEPSERALEGLGRAAAQSREIQPAPTPKRLCTGSPPSWHRGDPSHSARRSASLHLASVVDQMVGPGGSRTYPQPACGFLRIAAAEKSISSIGSTSAARANRRLDGPAMVV
jgi:hypothetical protein